MADDADALENRLTASYREQLGSYERALRSAQSLADTAELLAILNALAVQDARIAEDKAAWRRLGRSPGNDLRQVVQQVASAIRALAEVVDRRIAEAQAQKQKLAPDMDGLIQQRRMLRAYGAHPKAQPFAGR